MKYLVIVIIAMLSITTPIGIWMWNYIKQAPNDEHRETRILAAIASLLVVLNTTVSAGITIWASAKSTEASIEASKKAVWASDKSTEASIEASKKAMSASVRPFIRVTIRENPPNFVAENIGNGSAHDINIEFIRRVLGVTNSDEPKDELVKCHISSLAIGETEDIAIKDFIDYDNNPPRIIAHLEFKITYKDILDVEHSRTEKLDDGRAYIGVSE